MKKILFTLLFLSFNAHQMLASTGMNTDILISCDPSAPPMLQVITAFCAQGQPDNRFF